MVFLVPYNCMDSEFIIDSLGVLYKYTGHDKKIVIPDGVITINDATFYGNETVESIIIPDSTINIGHGAFAHCSLLSEVFIPKNVAYIGNLMFYKCTNLSYIGVSKDNNYYFSDNGVLFNKDKTELISYPVNKPEKHYSIPHNTQTIKRLAFARCRKLTALTFPNSLKCIEDSAFDRCESLKDIYIDDLISWCAIDFKNYGDYGDQCIVLHLNDEDVEELVLPEGLTSISNYAFSCCKALRSVHIPNSLKMIGKCAFLGCTNIQQVHIKSIKSWCDIYFKEPTSNPLYYAKKIYLNDELLIHLSISDSTPLIRRYAFYNCDEITDLKIMHGITAIHKEAFHNCDRLSKIFLPDSLRAIAIDAFSSDNNHSVSWVGVEKIRKIHKDLFGEDKLHVIHYIDVDFKKQEVKKEQLPIKSPKPIGVKNDNNLPQDTSFNYGVFFQSHDIYEAIKEYYCDAYERNDFLNQAKFYIKHNVHLFEDYEPHQTDKGEVGDRD